MQLVAAKPTVEDAAHFVKLAQMAGDNIFSEMLGSRAEPALRAMFARDDNDYSFRHATFLALDDQVAGLLQGFAAREARGSRTTWLTLRYAAWQLPRLLIVGSLMSDLLDFIASDLAGDDFYIQFVAVYPAFRGRGLSRVLLNKAAELALEHRCARLALDVDSRNRVAIGAYHKAGFIQIAESKTISHAGENISLLRLAKSLAND